MGRTTSIRRAAAGPAALLLVALLAGGAGAEPRGALETPLLSAADLVALGEAWWTRSPDPADPVACATCHFDPSRVRGWAAGFPKVKPLPPPHGRVMTLLQANAEAVTRHYGLADPRPAAIAITAYLSALGADLPRSPGVSPGQPVFAARMGRRATSPGAIRLLLCYGGLLRGLPS